MRVQINPPSVFMGLTVGLATLLASLSSLRAADQTPAVPARPASEPINAPTWTDNRCGGCHKIDATFSHPIGVAASSRIPAGFPTTNGRITCVTCHDDSSAAAHSAARTQHTSLLRAPEKGFCTNCHDPAGNRRHDLHAGSVQKAHARWSEEKKQTEQEAIASATFDLASSSCLGCHDGTTASAVDHTIRFSSSPWASGHPIGVEYRENRRGSTRLKPRAMLDPRIRLFDDAVGCESCHSLYSQQSGLLVMSNERSALCLSCHDL
jgi:predicted CXXCH cytochrome family protein